MATYSFLSVQATLSGVGGVVSLGSTSGAAKEGLSIDYVEDKASTLVGADGSIMQSLRASNVARVSVRLLKTSPANAPLSIMYNLQRLTPQAWGNNVMVISDINRGDIFSGSSVAFVKFPAIAFGEEAGVNEWAFIGSFLNLLGTGVPDANIGF